MFSKTLTFLLLVAVMINVTACGGAVPEDELRQVVLQWYQRENESLTIISAKKAPKPEFYPMGLRPPAEEVWCVVIDRSSNPNLRTTHYLVIKRGLLYSIGIAADGEYVHTMFLQVGCDNY